MSNLLVVVDTNIVISALIESKSVPGKFFDHWKKRKFMVITSSLLLHELEIVLDRPKYEKRYGITLKKKQKIVSFFRAHARIIDVYTSPPIVPRDAKDAMLIATAVSGDATHIVTGDKDVLVLDGNPHIGKLRIVTPRQFLDLLAR